MVQNPKTYPGAESDDSKDVRWRACDESLNSRHQLLYEGKADDRPSSSQDSAAWTARRGQSIAGGSDVWPSGAARTAIVWVLSAHGGSGPHPHWSDGWHSRRRAALGCVHEFAHRPPL